MSARREASQHLETGIGDGRRVRRGTTHVRHFERGNMSTFEADFPNNATAFTRAIGVLMRSPHYREYTIGDLEWLLIPPIANRQYRFALTTTSEADGSRTLPAAI